MSEIIRWVHPIHIDSGQLSEGAFPIWEFEHLNSHKAPSVIDRRYITIENKDLIHNTTCGYCERRAVESRHWPTDTDTCDCEKSAAGVRCALAKESDIQCCRVAQTYLTVLHKPTKNNPAHALLGTLHVPHNLERSELQELRILLLGCFLEVCSVKKIFASIP